MLNPSFSTSARGVASFCSALVRRLVSPRWAANCTGSWLAIGGTAAGSLRIFQQSTRR
jgi:hypothetical protein